MLKDPSGEFRNKLTILNKAGKIDNNIFQNLYQKNVDFSGKTKSVIDYLKKFKADKKKK